MYKACYRVLQVCSGGQRQAGLLLTRCSTKPVCTVRTAPGKQHETLDVIKSGRLEKRVVRHVKGRSIAVFILSARMHGEGLQGWRGKGGERAGEGGRERERESTSTHGLRTHTQLCTHLVRHVCVHTQQRLTRIPSRHCHSALYCANAQVWAPRFVQLSKTKLNFYVEQGGAVREQVDLLDIDVLAGFEEGKHDSLSVSLGVHGQGSETTHPSNCMISEKRFAAAAAAAKCIALGPSGDSYSKSRRPKR